MYVIHHLLVELIVAYGVIIYGEASNYLSNKLNFIQLWILKNIATGSSTM